MLINDPIEVNKLIKSKKCLIFDFDGVIVDSVEVKGIAFSDMYSHYGQDIAKKVFVHHHENGGMSRFEKFKYYHEYYLKKDISEQEILELSKCFSKKVVEKVISAPEIPGAYSFLKTFCDSVDCIINSATPLDELLLIIKKRKLDNYFKGVYGTPESKVGNLNLILKYLNLSPLDLVFFGDARSDYNAAEEVGVTFVGVGQKILPILEKSESVSYHIVDFNFYKY